MQGARILPDRYLERVIFRSSLQNGVKFSRLFISTCPPDFSHGHYFPRPAQTGEGVFRRKTCTDFRTKASGDETNMMYRGDGRGDADTVERRVSSQRVKSTPCGER
jgi:hypothetical protein